MRMIRAGYFSSMLIAVVASIFLHELAHGLVICKCNVIPRIL